MTEATAATRYGDEAARRAAVAARDAAADGAFVYSVATTGVYCRPSCPSRAARPENLAFHTDGAAARAAGFRPCRRCRPDEAGAADRRAGAIARACRILDGAEAAPALSELAAAAGMSPHHFHRSFRTVTGLTPRAWWAARRAERVRDGLAAGTSVTSALYDAGFNASSRFYAAAPAMLGMAPGRFRDGGRGEAVRYAIVPCTLGLLLVAASARGICAIALGDDADGLEAGLRGRFARATIAPDDAGLAGLVADVVALVEGRGVATLPLDIRGTAFQRQVWQALAAIPAGTTLSYAELAARIGSPGAVRAVAAACAANTLAVAIPCHRVVRSDGSLAGYRWGVERKRRLLEREAAGAPA